MFCRHLGVIVVKAYLLLKCTANATLKQSREIFEDKVRPILLSITHKFEDGYWDEHSVVIINVLAHSGTIAPLAEFMHSLFELLEQVPMLIVATHEEFSPLHPNWHA